MLQDIATPTPLELTTKETVNLINDRMYSVLQMQDLYKMELISYMRQLSVLLYVYNNQVFLLESRYDATKDDLKNALL
jgi:hypothetical protein